MNLKEKFDELFNYGKYYKMSNDDLEDEAGKFKIGGYFDGRIIRREKIIDQLIAKDNATMFKRSLIVSFITLICVIISLIASIIAIFVK